MSTVRSEGLSLLPQLPILLEISTYFTRHDEVIALATYLLQGEVLYGKAYVDSLRSEHTESLKALSVLKEWCKRKPKEANGKRLLEVLSLQAVNPRAAVDFRTRLLPTTWGKICE